MSRARGSAWLVAAGLLVAGLASPRAARAAGLYFSERGVRPLARGGAFVAGADEIDAVFHNPAGLSGSGSRFLLDGTWIGFSGSYTRRILTEQVDPNTGRPTGAEFERTEPTVRPTASPLMIPTLGYSNNLGTKHFDFALALGAPYALTGAWPRDVSGQPAPQRYSILSTDGSVLLVLGGWAAWRPAKWLALGAGVELLTGSLHTDVAISACLPDRFLCAPEQKDYDTTAKLRTSQIFAPSGNLGVTVTPTDSLRIGAAFQLPYWIHTPATLELGLPSAPLFSGARQSGDSAEVELRLPWTARVGVEVRPWDATRLEVAYVHEHWSMHDAISVTPTDVSLRGVQNLPDPFRVQPIALERHFRDSHSVRLGGEQRLPIRDGHVALRAGVMYETSAVPKEYVSVASLDGNKLIVGTGLGWQSRRLRVDFLLAHVFLADIDVSTSEAALSPASAVQANPPQLPRRVNAGTYSAGATLIGLGMSLDFDWVPPSKREPR